MSKSPMFAPMLTFIPAFPQDTTVVALARDGYSVFTAWTLGGLAVAILAVLGTTLLALAEIRRLSVACTEFLKASETRSQALVDHVSAAMRNVEQITGTVRAEVERVSESFGGLAAGIDQASEQLKERLGHVLALVDLAQSEAEDAVLDVASGVRAIRSRTSGVAALAKLVRRGRGKNGPGDGSGDRHDGKRPRNNHDGNPSGNDRGGKRSGNEHGMHRSGDDREGSEAD